MAAWFSQEAILKYRERIQTGEQRKEECVRYAYRYLCGSRLVIRIFSRLQAAGHDPQDIKLNWGLKCYDAVIKPQQLTERSTRIKRNGFPFLHRTSVAEPAS